MKSEILPAIAVLALAAGLAACESADARRGDPAMSGSSLKQSDDADRLPGRR